MAKTNIDPAAVLAKITSPRIVLIGAWHDIQATVPGEDYLHAKYLPDQPNFDIWCVEPQPWCIATLQQAAANARAATGRERVHVLPFAVSDYKGTAQFTIHSTNDMASSLRGFTPEFRDPKALREMTVEVRRIDDLMDEGLLPQGADYVTLDVQGCELEVLRGGERFFRQCRMVWLEVEFRAIYEGQALYREVRAAMERLGFRQVTEFTPEEEQQPWDDALYINDAIGAVLR